MSCLTLFLNVVLLCGGLDRHQARELPPLADGLVRAYCGRLASDVDEEREEATRQIRRRLKERERLARWGSAAANTRGGRASARGRC